MRILLSIVFFMNILFALGVTPQDLQKYEQYKSLIDDKNIDQKSAKEIKTEVAVNNIKATNGEVKATVKNLFKYGYENIKLNRYGQSFFQNKNILNNTLIPTSNNYILNNGDTIYINTYGTKNTKTYELKIDNNGNINIPDIGLLKVASLSFAEAKTVVTNTITKAFPRTKVIVDISGYSSIQVVVTGNVKVPGIYNLSSFSTIKDALINANGLLEVGSYRDINVVRNGKKIYTFDLYKLLTSADKQNDILLRSGDIITVNFTKKSLTLTGKVKNQAIYELKDKESFQDLLRYSGGFSYDATKNSIKLTRYDENQKLQTLILSKNKLFSMTPKDGDKIEVFNNYEIKEKPYVYVHGKVVKDDSVKYKYFEGMNLKELYTMVTFRSEIYKDKIRETLFVDKENIKIIRHNDDEKSVFLISLEDSFILEPFDEVEFFNYFDTNPRVSVSIKGEVYKSGEIYINNNTTFKELVNLAGGFTKKAYKKEFELVRYMIVNDERIREIQKLTFDEAKKSNFKLQDNDEITIFTIPNWYDTKKVVLKGEVRFPGTYTVSTGEKLSNIIQRAGGFTKEAFIAGAVFSRESIKVNEAKRMNEAMLKLKQQISFLSTNVKQAGQKEISTAELVSTINLLEKQANEYVPLGRLVVYLDSDIEKFKNSEFDIRLENKDTLIVPSINDTVSVYGEVMNPSSFIYNSENKIEDYIEKAGSLTQRADEEAMYIVFANGEAKKIGSGYLFNDFASQIKKGSTIIVPMKVSSVSNILLWKEVSQIVYQLAITAASLKTVGGL